MDPISAVGLVVKFADKAFSIVLTLQNYREAVKKALKHSAELRREIRTLWKLLESLDAVSNNAELSSVSHNGSRQELESMLDKLNKRVKPSKTAGFNRLK